MKKQYKTVAELLKDRRRWCKGALAEDKLGCALSNPCGDYAVRWCLIGAVEKIYGITSNKGHAAIKKLRILLPDEWSTLDVFNDDNTHKEVLALCKKAKV